MMTLARCAAFLAAVASLVLAAPAARAAEPPMQASAAGTATAAPPAAASAPRVMVQGGSVVGVQQGEVASFKGIPFAAPPVGERRWRPPQAVASWQGDLVADRFSPMCLQPLRPKNSVFYLGEEPSSEDCLHLNVWSTAQSGDKHPVMVFVYGGGWTIGSASLPLYSGEALAKKGVVVVTFNYRVGALGFLAHPELTVEGKGTSGNYGLMDMIAALRWVKANIAQFGGDPASVTLYGQSAGAVAVGLLQASPQAGGLFHRAIGQSGGYSVFGPLRSRDDAEKAGVALAEKLKVKTLRELREFGGDAIMNSDNRQRPILDGVVLQRQPSEIFGEGKQLAMPLLVGANADEGTVYPVVMTPAAFEADARERYGVEAGALLALYQAKTEAEARAASYALMRDRTFGAPMRRWAVEQARIGPVYMYHFSRVHPFVDTLAFQQQNPASALGAYHGAEMAYAYGNLDALNRLGKTRDWTDEDRKYSETMMAYWVSFARSGDPNSLGLPTWPAYKPEEEQVLLFGRDIKPGDLPNKKQLDFFRGP